MRTKTLAAITMIAVAGCSTDANIASRNISKSADMFEINRRVVFYDSIQGTYLLSIEGLCSIEKQVKKEQLAVTCKVGPQDFKKHFLGVASNVTYFAEQLEPSKQNAYYYRVIFKPESIIPDINLTTSALKH